MSQQPDCDIQIDEILRQRSAAQDGLAARAYPRGDAFAVFHIGRAREQDVLENEVFALALQRDWTAAAMVVQPEQSDLIGIAWHDIANRGVLGRFNRIAIVARLADADIVLPLLSSAPSAHVVFLDGGDTLPDGFKDSNPVSGWLVADFQGRRASMQTVPVGLRTVNLPGTGSDCLGFLKRFNLLQPVLVNLVQSTTDASKAICEARARRLFRPYRITIEERLRDKGQGDRATRFSRAFRLNAKQANKLLAAIPQPPASPVAPRRPRTMGNVWHLEDRGGALLYLSDQYDGQTSGFEERGGVTLGQTGDVALISASLGGPATIRPVPEHFDYHIIDERLRSRPAMRGAQVHAVLSLRLARHKRHALKTHITLSEPCAGMQLEEATPESPLVQKLLDRIEAAKKAMEPWRKHVFLDRVILNVSTPSEQTGAPASDRQKSDFGSAYARRVAELRRLCAKAAGQISLPHVVVNQSAGKRVDGTDPHILTEGRLDVHNAGLGVIMATPLYPFSLMPDTVATLDPKDQLLVDELQALAVDAVQSGRRWYCPTLRQVFQIDRRVIADFACMSSLVLDASRPHGFRLDGCKNEAQLTDIAIEGSRVLLDFDRAPQGDAMRLSYAWGFTEPTAKDRFANHGALRDDWAAASLVREGAVLHRYALAASLPVMPSDLE